MITKKLNANLLNFYAKYAIEYTPIPNSNCMNTQYACQTKGVSSLNSLSIRLDLLCRNYWMSMKIDKKKYNN